MQFLWSLHVYKLKKGTRDAEVDHPLAFKVSRCRTSQFARSFLPAQVFRMWNGLPYTVFDTGTLDGFKGAVNRWLLARVVFSSIFYGACACEVRKEFINNFVFPTWAFAAGLNNNNNNGCHTFY